MSFLFQYTNDMEHLRFRLLDYIFDQETPETMKILKENMKKAAGKGFINATDCADYLVKKGLAFRDAYKITGKIVGYCIDTNNTLDTLRLEQYKEVSEVFDEDIYEYIDLINCLNSLTVIIQNPL